MIQSIIIILALADPNSLVLSVMGSPPEILPLECQWLDDPNLLPTLFEEFEVDGWYPSYLYVIVDNWLRTDRRCWMPRMIEGVWYVPWIMSFSLIGDLNHDGIVNNNDLGILAENYYGGLKSPEKKATRSSRRTYAITQPQEDDQKAATTPRITDLETIYGLLLLMDTVGKLD